MSTSTPGAAPSSAIVRLAARLLSALERIPYTLIAIPLRFALATVFWNAAMTHLANWQATMYLFENDYRLPFLAPHPAAYLAVAIEVSTPVLLAIGLLTRVACAALLGMVTVIEVFVYPLAWPTHIQWAAMLFVLLARGPGMLSVDGWIRRRLAPA